MTVNNAWDGPANLRRQQIESGLDLTFSKVFLPLYRKIVASIHPTSIIEIGSGTGHLAKELSQMTSKYVGLEPSPGMVDVAREVTVGSNVSLHQTRLEDFPTGDFFDLAISHMCLHSVENPAEFLKALSRRLAPTSVYIIAIPHPAFFNDYKKVIAGETYSYMRESSGLIDFTITLDPNRVISQVPYHHRPISTYFSELNSAGVGVSYYHEVFPDNEIQSLYGTEWRNPRYLLLGGGLQHPNGGAARSLMNLQAECTASRL